MKELVWESLEVEFALFSGRSPGTPTLRIHTGRGHEEFGGLEISQVRNQERPPGGDVATRT